MNPAITTIPSIKVESRHGMFKKLVVMVNMAERISPASHATTVTTVLRKRGIATQRSALRCRTEIILISPKAGVL